MTTNGAPPPNGPSAQLARSRSFAAAWAFLFAAMSVYWALGGMAGVDQLGVSIQRDAEAREGAFVASLWGTAALKAAGGALVLSLHRHRLLRLAGWVAGVLLLLYGGAGLVEKLLIELGAIDVPDGLGTHAIVRWYLFLWDPFWLLGGALFCLAARDARR